MNTENNKVEKQEFEAVVKSVEEIHKFYLILFTYVVMVVYLNWLDLRDDAYTWAYWPTFGFTCSMIWFSAVMLPFKRKSKLIQKELKGSIILNNDDMKSEENYSVREYERAKKVVEDKIGFYIHLLVYLIINTFCVYLSLFHSQYFWATWTIFGWGIGLFFHGMRVFGTTSNWKWREKQIRKEIERQRKNRENLKQ